MFTAAFTVYLDKSCLFCKEIQLVRDAPPLNYMRSSSCNSFVKRISKYLHFREISKNFQLKLT